MQRYEVGKNAMRARIAISGIAASRNFRRNMHKLARTRSNKRRDHGWRSVKKTRYRGVDMTPGQLIGSGGKSVPITLRGGRRQRARDRTRPRRDAAGQS